MPDYFQITGIEEVTRACDSLQALVTEELSVELPPVMDGMAGALSIYPAERAGQRYRRTGALGEGWRSGQNQIIRRAGGGISLRRRNRMPYTEFVQGDEQMWAHRGRWQTVRMVEGEYVNEITVAGQRAANRAAKRAFKSGK